MLDITHWSKTPDGQEWSASQRPFILGGQIWQAYNGAFIQTQESQVSTEELLNFPDIDDTREKILFRRRQRVEARYLRKGRELGERRAKLREQKNQVLTSIERDKAAGLEASEADKAEVHEISTRMGLLNSQAQEEELRALAVRKKEDPRPEIEASQVRVQQPDLAEHSAPPAEPDQAATPESVAEQYGCRTCDKKPPPGKRGNKARSWRNRHENMAHGPAAEKRKAAQAKRRAG